MNKYFLIIGIVLAIFVGGYFFSRNNSNAPEPTAPKSQENPTILPLPSLIKADEQMIMMDAKSFSFSPKEIRVKVGQPVIIRVSSQGRHTFTVNELDVNVSTPDGQTTTVQFTPARTGHFEFYCAIPGHRDGGMVGMLIVE